ncbi:MAG: histidine kinase N-terminal 7TM domain-containing protein, partial [Halohasta sp.]
MVVAMLLSMVPYLLADPADGYAALRWMWVGSVPFVTLWLVFVITYTDRTVLFERRVLGLLVIEPVVVLAAALTTPLHGLFVTGQSTGIIGGYEVVLPLLGPIFALHQVYVFLATVASLLLLIRTLGDTDPAYHSQLLVLIAAGSLLLIGPLQQLSTPMITSIHGPPLVVSLFGGLLLFGGVRYHLFDVLPTARGQILSTMEEGVVLVDDDDRIRLANAAARRQLSLPEPVIGSDAASVLPCGKRLLRFRDREDLPKTAMHATGPEAAHRTDGGMAQLRPHPSGVELFLEASGEERHFIVTTNPVPDETSIEGQLLVFRNVTAQRDQELEFQAVIEHTTDVVTILDPDGQISYVSPSVDPELSYTQFELVGTDVAELFHPDDTPAVEAEIASVEGTDEVIHSQYRIETGNGEWRMVETTVRGGRSTPVTDGAILTTRDITERYRHQQRRRVMNRVLRHDLRNDMNVVVGHAEILVDALDDDRVRHAETIERTASDLVQLGEKVRKIDQRLHGRDRDLKRVDLSRVVEDEIESLHEQFPEAAIRTCIEEASILGDTLIRAAVANLIENAIEHNDSPRPEVDVSVSTDPDTGRVELAVSDNGPGIPEAEKRVITAGVETPLEHISGLGLWLVKWIVEGMDGELEIETTDPRGSVITLSFPSFDQTTATRSGDESVSNAETSTEQFIDTVGSREGGAPIQTSTRGDGSSTTSRSDQ